MKPLRRFALISALTLLSTACTDSANEDDRYSQSTGALSGSSTEILPATRKVLNEDEAFVASVITTQALNINVQAENLSNTTMEVFTLDEANYNRYRAEQSFTYIKALSMSPLAASFSSQWTALSAGRYYFILDNTDRGAVSPPWNGSNDKVTAMMTVLSTLASDESSLEAQDQETTEGDQDTSRLIETSVIRVSNPEGI